jgi:thioredoxin 1
MAANNPYQVEQPTRASIDVLSGPTVVEFGTDWCGYCRGAQSDIVAALEQHPQVRHLKVEDGKGRPLGRSFAVKLWPTLILLQEGKEVGRVVRPQGSQEITALLARMT